MRVKTRILLPNLTWIKMKQLTLSKIKFSINPLTKLKFSTNSVYQKPKFQFFPNLQKPNWEREEITNLKLHRTVKWDGESDGDREMPEKGTKLLEPWEGESEWVEREIQEILQWIWTTERKTWNLWIFMLGIWDSSREREWVEREREGEIEWVERERQRTGLIRDSDLSFLFF